MGRARPKRGERRIDAAIDHLACYGFPKPQIREVINDLLQLYGRDGWMFLVDGSYSIVLEKLLEKQEAAAVDEASSENGMEVSRVHGEPRTESRSALEPQDSPNNPLVQEHVVPVPPATGAARTRAPCYGWISEEDSETESELEDEEMISNALRPETLPSKRKRPTRWDVHPNRRALELHMKSPKRP